MTPQNNRKHQVSISFSNNEYTSDHRKCSFWPENCFKAGQYTLILISHEVLMIRVWLSPQNDHKQQVSISFSNNVYTSDHRKSSFCPENCFKASQYTLILISHEVLMIRVWLSPQNDHKHQVSISFSNNVYTSHH